MTTTSLHLYSDAIDAKPRGYDFNADTNADYGDNDTEAVECWRIVLPDVEGWTAARCRAWLDDQSIDYVRPRDVLQDDEEDDDENGDALREQVREAMDENESYAPMMNFIYPVPGLRMTSAQAQEAIQDTGACVIVEVGDVPYLALAGGGMDLSWDICRAYVALGYYPPIHFEPPRMAFSEYEQERNVPVMEAYIEACRIAAMWAESKRERVQRMLDEARALT